MKILFFDLDGTLTDIFQREVYAIYDTAKHFGLKVSKTKVARLCEKRASYFDVLRELKLELTNDVIEYWSSAFISRYRLSILRKGTKSTLQALSQQYRLFCVTSREGLTEVTSELKFLGIEGFFDQTVTREVAAKHFGLPSLPFLPFHEQRKKLYECALSMAACHPSKVLVVGDMASELKPAKELGIVTVGLLTEKTKENELRKDSDYLVSGISDVRKVLHKFLT